MIYLPMSTPPKAKSKKCAPHSQNGTPNSENYYPSSTHVSNGNSKTQTLPHCQPGSTPTAHSACSATPPTPRSPISPREPPSVSKTGLFSAASWVKSAPKTTSHASSHSTNNYVVQEQVLLS